MIFFFTLLFFGSILHTPVYLYSIFFVLPKKTNKKNVPTMAILLASEGKMRWKKYEDVRGHIFLKCPSFSKAQK